MTPDQLAVERDRLLEGGRTLEEVARMQAATRLLEALSLMCLCYGRELDIEERRAFAFVNSVLAEADGSGVYFAQFRGQEVETRLKLLAGVPPVEREALR